MTFIIPILIGSVLAQIVILVFAAILAPRMSRPDIFFSVTVEPSFRDTDAGRDILLGFNRAISLWSLLGMVVALTAVFTRQSILMSSLLLFSACVVQWVGMIQSYTVARRRTLPNQVVPSMEREAELKPRRLFPIKAWIGQLGPLLILGLVSAWLWCHWDEIPARYPIHWGIDGRPNGWGGRTIGNVFMLPIKGAIVCVFFAIFMQALARGVRRIHSSGPEAEKETRNLRNMSRVMLGVEYWFAVMFGALAFLPFLAKSNHQSIPMPAVVIFSALMSLVIVAVIILMAVKSGQGGWRLADDNNSKLTSAKTAPVGDRTPDSCWKAGIIYYNPNDPAVWVEKRFGYGWTLNMATRAAWVIMGAILLFGVGVPILSLFLLKK